MALAVVAMSLADSLHGVQMSDSASRGIALREVVVSGNSSTRDIQMRSALNTVNVGSTFISENFGGSLMQTLERLPGVKAMSIGSGQSKPAIRGLGFNRLVVTENGVKHEGQQWGDDHGLETDQFAVDRVEIVKGPAALGYGSDAIGGVINLRSDKIPERSFGGNLNFFARSNNESVGASLRLEGRGKRLFWKLNATLIDYADYKVTADSIQYYSYYIKLKDRRLRNTAGWERDGSLTVGGQWDSGMTYFRFSDVNTKSGFFANAHGLEVRLSDINYDRNDRDIDLPCRWVNHFQAMNHTEWRLGALRLDGDFAYQNNYQKEMAEPVAHGYMPKPSDELERSFTKHTATANVRIRTVAGMHSLQAGVSAEYQRNIRGGWGFVIPDYSTMAFGGYLSDRIILSERLILSAGIRLDHGTVDIDSYTDWYKTPTADGDSAYTLRSADMRRSFTSLTWSAGINWNLGDWVLKANIGKGFRMPIAKELGMDGVNYNIFRYERGNPRLSAEESYQLDAGIIYEKDGLTLELTPYVNYFPNYIYLNPTAEYREGLQLYYYSQSRVFRWGFEADVTYAPHRHWEVSARGEYLYARQLSGEKKGYTLPFSTPWSAAAVLKYLIKPGSDASGFVSIEWKTVGRQTEVVPPEEPTDGYQLLNAAAGKTFSFGACRLRVSLQCQNILDTRYYDHVSYYRLIGVPEPGRNVSLMAGYEF